MKYYLTSTKIKKKNNCWQGYGKNGTLLMGTQNGIALWKTFWQMLYILQIPNEPEILLRGVYLKEMVRQYPYKTFIQMLMTE